MAASSGTGSPSATSAMVLDQATLDWATVICGSIARYPNTMPTLDPSKPFAVELRTAVRYYTGMSQDSASNAAVLSRMPAPTFPGGDRAAATVIRLYQAQVPAAAQQAELVGAAATRTELKTAVDKAGAAMDRATAGLPDIEPIMSRPGLRAALAKVPACKESDQH